MRLSTASITKLRDDNYEDWNLEVLAVLRAANLLGVVDGTTARPSTPTNQPAWNAKDAQAQAILIPTLEKRQKTHIYTLTTAKEIYDRLKNVNSDSSALYKQHTLSLFLNYKYSPEKSLVTCFLEIEDLARHLNNMGMNIDESMTITKVVSSLPDELDAFKKAWDSVPTAAQTMRNLLARIRKEELERKQKGLMEDSQDGSTSVAYHSRDGRNVNSRNKARIEK